MNQFNKHAGFLLACAGCLLLTLNSMAADEIKGNLVTAAWLEKNLNNADVLILDASPTQIYTSKHIPGAIGVDIYTWYGLREMPVGDMEKLFQSWGISSGKTIVMYDQGGTMLATRLFYSLYYHGFPAKDLLILDGGLSRWQEEGLPTTSESTPVPGRGSFKIENLKEEVKVRLPEFLTASGDPVNHVLLEALSADWHFGEILAFDRAGHIPNAILMPTTDFYNPDKTFKSAEEINKMLNYLGISPDQQVYTHCGGGVAASVPFFALKFLVDYPNVKLYKESQLGWLSDERGLPYWTYDAPYLMRESNWLQFWGGQMFRRFGGAAVSIIDLRPEGAFKQGHMPLAINIPAAIFKGNIANPGHLTEILGPAGVSASEEAVVFFGKGLTKEAALAFVLLEKLGQKKVSLFMDSLDTWIQKGFPVIKDSSAGGTKEVTAGQSLPPVTYSGKKGMNVIISDPKNTMGTYPRVFIASGRNLPDGSYDGNVVHVPYTNLLDNNGTPKEAKDIWNILVKAGVPRYAELVCLSEDPGESAINYFILKLMGFRDIKILLI